MELAAIANGPITWTVIGLAVLAGVSAVMKDVLVDQISRRIAAWRPKIPLSSYKSRLQDRLAEMPFLYRDIRLSAKDDYVEVSISTADSQVKPLGLPSLDFRTPLIRFKEARRAILFGDGGFGKTTLFRHISLRVLEAKKDIFEPRLVPIFVALKTVKLSSDYPILDSIQSSDPYFGGEAGYRKLRRLAKRRKLLIFLDGYDELPYAGGLQHVLQELETLFGAYNSRAPTFFEAQKDFYIFAQECRIYLSSRREFFFHNQFHVSPFLPKWLVRGLGDRRAELVEKIFAKYRTGNNFFEEKLDQELFLQQLADACDQNLEALSFSPLFLTVMCYVYVDAVKDGGVTNGASIFLGGAPTLVQKCINLLVADVDEYKARGLGDTQRAALVRRRSAYRQEKYEFLKYFAAQLYEQSMSVFTRDDLVSKSKRFFASSDFEDGERIMRGLDSEDPTVNIVDQLIFCGLFVLVDCRLGQKSYDFPHRRFRETLAVAFYDSPQGAALIAESFDRPAYGELALVYVEQSNHAETVLFAVLDRLNQGIYDARHGEFLVDALTRVGAKRAELVAHRFIELLALHPDAKVPVDILDFLPRDEIYVGEVLKKLEESVAAERIDIPLRLTCLVAVSEGWTRSATQAVKHANPRALRLVLYAQVTFPREVVSLLVDRLITASTNSRDLSQALSDIYRVLVVGRGDVAKLVVRERVRHHLPFLASMLEVDEHGLQFLPASIDHVYGGAILPEGASNCLRVPKTSLASPLLHFYSRA